MRVHAAVRREWQSSYERRRTLRWGIPLALTAAAIVAAVLMVPAPQVAVAPVATVALVGGGQEGQGSPGGSLAPGDPVYPGVALATGDGGVALTLNNGLSVRLDAATTATFEAVDSVTLDQGRLYADTGQSIYDDRSLTVRTRVGSARDVGTQFAVAYDGDDMRVAVREGRVDVAAGRQSWTAQAGDLLTLAAGSGASFDRVSPHDASWGWASSLAPAFDIENRSLLDFLKWAARETGRELVFESEEVRLAAMRTTLSGSIEDFTPMEAVDSVMPTTRFAWRVDERSILVRTGH